MKVTEPVEWLTLSVIGAMTALINLSIVKKECKKRKQGLSRYTTKQLRIWSMVCMVSGVFFGFFYTFLKTQGFCRFEGAFAMLTHNIQATAMGYYQLARLYYCFASSKVYSHKGYPTWLFTVMYMLPALSIICAMSVMFVHGIELTNYCGINKKWKFVSDDSGLLTNPATIITWSTNSIVFLLWDFATLLLYICRGISFKKYKSENIDVFHRIMSMLAKITILTIMYEIPGCLVVVAGAIRSKYEETWSNILVFFMCSCNVITVNYSMYLMQSHNTGEYRRSLKCMQKIGALKMCCCFQAAIKYELEQNNVSDVPVNGRNDNHGIEDTVFETRDIRIPQRIKQIELSVETTVTNM